MSSPIANVIRCAAGIKTNSPVLTNPDESELAFLEEKPTVGRKPASKARRNNFIKYMMKKDQNEKYIQKVVVNENKLSKKSRARLLSNLNDDMNLNVPYSLNRKNRWEDVESAADLVKAANESDDVVVSGIDCTTRLSMGPNVAAYHELSPEGELKSKICSNIEKGANLESLKDSLNPKSKKNKRRARKLAFAKIVDEDEEKIEEKPHVRYSVRKMTTVPMLYAGWIYNKTYGSDWNRTRNYKDEDYLDDLEPSNFEDESEVDMTSSITAFYRAPKKSTFSLGDFIKDSSPVVLINSKSIESIAECQEKSEPETCVKKQSSPTPGNFVDEKKLCKDTLFIEVEVQKSKIFGNSKLSEFFNLIEDRPDLRFRWLNMEKNRCVFDLTKKLDEHTSKMAMVVVIEELKTKEGILRVVLNGSFGCPSGVVIDFLEEKSFVSPDAFVEQFVERLQKWYNKSQESKKQLNSLAALNSIFHGHQLAKPVEPSGDYVIVDEAAAKAPTVEAIMIDVEEEEDDDDDMDFDEFEVVEMDDLISEADEEEPEDELEVLPDFGSGCDLCDTDNVDELVILDNCGHRFCKRCLRTELTDAIVRKTAYPLACLHESCNGGIQMDFLITILPLPLAEYYFRFAFMAENVANGKVVVECPHCQDLAAVDGKPSFGSVKCTKCSISFCSRCQHQPHFPLSCQQMSIWEEKFEKQFPVDIGRKSANGNKRCSCGEVLQNPKNQSQIICSECNVTYNWKTGESTGRFANKNKVLEILDLESLPNNIAGEFSEICSRARSLRFNLVANRQITKKMCKSNDFRLKQGFIEIRKTALHLIEFGFAWLYMTRNDKPSTWSSIKANLSNLRSKLEAIHSDIERGQTDGIELKVNELNGLTQKILDEFSAMS